MPMTFLPGLKKPKSRKRGLTITISGPSGSGKSFVAVSMAKAFSLKNVSTGQIFRQLAAESGKPLEAFLKGSAKRIHLAADQRAANFAAKGGYVLDGRLTAWAAGDSANFRIFLTAPLAIRAKRISLRDRIPLAVAKRRVANRDKIDVTNFKRVYGLDSRDLSIYHLVLDTSLFDAKETSRTVLKVLKAALKN